MKPTNGFFEIEQVDETIILTPTADMGELDNERINSAMKHVLDLLTNSSIKNLVLDFHRTEYYGSTALGFFVRLWKTISGRKGRMAFCNASEHEKEILKITKLDSLWDICATREESLRVVQSPTKPGEASA
jgi:anti-anti-sigma factor